MCCLCAGIQITSVGALVEGSPLFTVICSAEVAGEGNNVTILFEGEGLAENLTTETTPGNFTNTVSFTSLTASASGMYRCTLLVNDVMVDTQSFGIDVIGTFLDIILPVIDRYIRISAEALYAVSLSQPTEPATAGINYAIRCDVDFVVSNASVSFQWLGPDDNPVILSNGFQVLTQNLTSMLQFDPARESHEGNYSCQVTLNITVTETSAEVEVNGNSTA